MAGPSATSKSSNALDQITRRNSDRLNTSDKDKTGKSFEDTRTASAKRAADLGCTSPLRAGRLPKRRGWLGRLCPLCN